MVNPHGRVLERGGEMRPPNGLVATTLCYRCVNRFINDPFAYAPHEEQYITNPHDIILLNYDASSSNSIISRLKPIIASYELNYQRGRVIALGIF